MAERTPLLLIPGLLCDEALWRHQIDHLGEVADTTVADHTRHDRMEDIAASILQAAPPRFALAGLSMGGYIALEILRVAPERVLRLALLDTTARPDTPEAAQRRRDLLALVARGNFKGVTRQMLPLFIHPDRLGDETLTRPIMEMGERVGSAAYVRQQTAILNRRDARPNLAAIHCPTLVICGRQDALTPLPVSEELASGIPNATLTVIEDCAHLPTMERPQAATALMRLWLVQGRTPRDRT